MCFCTLSHNTHAAAAANDDDYFKFYFVCMDHLPVSLCPTRVPAGPRSQKMMLHPLELEL